jgi:hypothetical protein
MKHFWFGGIPERLAEPYDMVALVNETHGPSLNLESCERRFFVAKPL